MYSLGFSVAKPTHLRCSSTGEPDDLWDFGTVRNALTVGRSKPNPVQVSGPPLTWENNGTTRSDGSSASGHHSFTGGALAKSSSLTAKGDLPPLPPSAPQTPRRFDTEGTIRQAANGLSREPSDEYDDDYEDQEINVQTHTVAEDELPDTTMLDSVVLPAIASVSLSLRHSCTTC